MGFPSNVFGQRINPIRTLDNARCGLLDRRLNRDPGVLWRAAWPIAAPVLATVTVVLAPTPPTAIGEASAHTTEPSSALAAIYGVVINAQATAARHDEVMIEDPGWQLSWRVLFESLVPQLAIRRATRDRTRPQLLVLRQVFVSFAVALALVSVVVVGLGDVSGEESRVALSCGLAVGAGMLSLVLGTFVKRQLDFSSDSALAMSYRTRLFLRLAYAESAALTSFVLVIALGPPWVYAIGLAFAVIGFARSAPSARNLEADQRRLSGEGCHRSLLAALLVPQTSESASP